MFAQSLTGSMAGTVSDTTGGVLPGASVVITNADTNVKVWEGAADAEGAYLAPSLTAGTYDISVALTGFRAVTIAGVHLETGQKSRIDAELPAGQMEDLITVVGEPLGRLESEDSAIGVVIDTSKVRNLPLPSRNVLNLLTLAGGVSSGGAATGIVTGQLSINGSRTLNSEFTVDGLSMVSGSVGDVNRLPSTEAIREFKVQTAGYSAEYGRSVGALVTLIVDSGTSAYRGGLYEYHRHERFNANNYFNNLRSLPRPADRYNQFGAKLGGPIPLPGVARGEEKTFFFVNYEALRRQAPAAVTSTLPDAAFRAGNFSASPVIINDPLTGQPFPGNRIPDSRIDPAARRILGLLPAPNATGTADAANGRRTNNYINDVTLKPQQNEITARLDHQAGPNARLFGRFTVFDQLDPVAATVPGPLNNSTSDRNAKGYGIASGWTQVWSSALISDINVGYLSNDPQFDPPSAGLNVGSEYGIARSSFAASPRFTIAGWQVLGMNFNTFRRELDKNVSGSASVTWVHGGHVTKIGGQLRRNQFDVFNPGGDFAGAYNFTGEVTSPTRAANNPIQAMADFLLGQVKTSVYELAQPRTLRQNTNMGAFVQDDWKVSTKLTLNLGLRWEYESPTTISGDIFSRLDTRPGAGYGRLLVAGKNASRALDLEGDRLNFAPRVGFAYMLSDKTVLRSAFGLFYGQIFSNLGGVVLYPGFTVRQEFANLGAGVAQPFRLAEGMPLVAQQNLADPFFAERAASPSRPLSVQAGGNNQYGRVSPLPFTMRWNTGFQHELFRGTVIDINYVGSRGKNLPVLLNQNTVPLDRTDEAARAGTALAAQQLRPNPNVTSFAAFVHEGESWYHSAQARLARKFSERLSFQLTYTYSKSIDTGSGIFNFSAPTGLDIGDLAGAPGISDTHNRGLSGLDRPHIFAGAVQYETGGPKLIRGLQVSALVTARSGLPSTIKQTNLADWNIIPSLPARSGLQQRPNVKSGASTDVTVPQEAIGTTGIRVLMSPTNQNFPFTPSGPFYVGTGASRRLVVPFTGAGTLGRSTVRGPNEFNVDMSVARRFAIKGRLGFTLRAEAFNVLNQTNFDNPDTSLIVAADAAGNAVFNSPNFGLITTAKAARFVQFVARLDF